MQTLHAQGHPMFPQFVETQYLHGVNFSNIVFAFHFTRFMNAYIHFMCCNYAISILRDRPIWQQ